MIMSKQLFLANIKYKNKQFAVFTNKYHTKSFLEISEDGRYSYPVFVDFLELYKIYNSHDIENFYSIKDINFEQFVTVVNNQGKKVLKKLCLC